MKAISLGLRSKILLASLILLVPLLVTLVFLYQYSDGQIRTAILEKEGLKATAPLMKALIGWQSEGVDGPPSEGVAQALTEYAELMPGLTVDLAYTPEALKAAGHPWAGTQALADLAKAGAKGDPQAFIAVHQALASDLLYLADSSGLVLDPDIDSYYLMLALYQGIPNLLDGETQLRAFSRPGNTSLSATDKLSMFARASEVRQVAATVGGQVTRSIQGIASAYGPVPGYEETMKGDLEPLVAKAREIESVASQSALANSFDAGSLNAPLDQLPALLQTFFDHGRAAFDVMLDHRIGSFTGNLVTAYAVTLGGLVIGWGAMLWVAASVRRRTAQLVSALGAVARGDLSQEIPDKLLTTRDELGQLAGSVKVLRTDLRAQVESLAQATDHLSKMSADLAANTEESAAAIEQMSATSAQVAKYAQNQLDQTGVSGRDIGSMLNDVKHANDLTQGMATQFFLFSQSMEANRRRIASTAAEAKTTGDLSEALTQTGADGEKSLESLRQAIGGVVKKTQEIHEIVQFILDITDRTNLLSMNAAIEAAHAGASGRGFAVVADEIRKLAETSSKQAQSIKILVDGIAEAAAHTLDRSENTSQSFRSVSQDIGAVRTASLAIADQMVQQEAEDAQLSQGLEEFTRFYAQLSESMTVQVNQSQTVQQAIDRLGDAAREISHSMQEQKLGMEQATEAVIQVRDTTVQLARVMDDLKQLMGRFQT